MESMEARRLRATPAQTPAKTPARSTDGATFKTPLRTPLSAAEQRSSTPITPFETIEAHKENVQPRQRGHSAHALSSALKMRPKERHEMLQAQRQEHEARVTSAENAEADDPLEAWCAYVKWCMDNYPEGKSAESGLVPLLERATRTFKDAEQYHHDSRYLRLWILYAQQTDVPRDVYHFLLANDIGTKLASLYEELANVLESHDMWSDADETYKLGIARRAAPLDRLKRRYQEYQARVVAHAAHDSETPTYTAALSRAMAAAGRSVLGTRVGHGESVPTNVLGHHQPLSSSARPNARAMAVYEDDDENGAPSSASRSTWSHMGNASERRKENTAAPKHVKPLAQAATPKAQVRALEVFCDSDEDGSPKRTPRADAVLTRMAPSQADQLRANPFLLYDAAAQAQAKMPPRVAEPAAARPPHARTEAPRSAASRAAAPGADEPRASSSRHRSRTSKPVAERHAAPLARLYPDVDITAAVQDKARPMPKTVERCMEEVLAQRYLPRSHAQDPWAYLDETQGQWCPDLAPPRRRAPSPTLLTKAAMEEVELMFNGESDSDTDAESDGSSDADDPSAVSFARVHSENVLPPTPAPRMERRVFGTPKPISTPVPPAPAAAPALLEVDEDESGDEDVPHRVPFQPLTPITERTEMSRWTSASDEAREASQRSADVVQLACAEKDARDGAEASDSAAPEAQGAGAAAYAPPAGGLRQPPAALALPNPCSPADPDVVRSLLGNLVEPVTSWPTFQDCRADDTPYLSEWAGHVDARAARRASLGGGTMVDMAGVSVALCQRLGEGGFGSVFLVHDVHGAVPYDGADDDEEREMVAVKIESPPNWWEYYMLAQLHTRLPPPLRASIIHARQLIAAQRHSLLVLDYAANGTLLELVNHASAAGVSSALNAGASGVEEVLAMFYVIELMRLVEGMHEAGLLHGDLKIDNCMIRAADTDEWASVYQADGSQGWAAKGLTLVDFGRSIDLVCYPPDQRFLADWQPGVQDCVEMKEMRPWTFQADYYGLASVAYCLLYGRYMETTSYVNERGHKTYKIQQPLRRYWQTELWTRFFTLLLNPTQEAEWPVTAALAALRRDMEAWLTAHSFHAGKNLKGLLKKVEIWALRRA